MKKLFCVGLALVALVFLSFSWPARADTPPGWYGTVGGIANMPTDSSTHPPGAPSTLIHYDTGWGVLGSLGHEWNSGLRLEGEVAYSHADVDHVDGSAITNGHLANTDFFGNLIYDIKTGMRLTPYVGAGAGFALADADHILLPDGSALNDERLKFAYQAIGGLAFPLDNHWAVSADYRYVRTLDPSYDTTFGGRARTENASHNIVVSLRYTITNPPKPAPALQPAEAMPPPQPQPPVAQAPAVPPVPQSYMVFFDFDKSDLTPEAKRILAAAAQDYQRGGFVRVVVTGHTDTVGSDAYNLKLSQRRANAVKAELIKDGVSDDQIDATGVGKKGLLVPTANGVREAQNRRAEIVFRPSGQPQTQMAPPPQAPGQQQTQLQPETVPEEIPQPTPPPQQDQDNVQPAGAQPIPPS